MMSKKRELPIRKCVVTGHRLHKDELLRIVRADGVAVIDATGTLAGRGAYIISDADVIKKAKKKNSFTRALRIKVDEKVYDKLLEMVDDKVTGGDPD